MPGRSPPGRPHRPHVLHRRPPRQRGAGHARLHRHLRGPADLGAGQRDGLPQRRHRLRGADPARRGRASSGSARAAPCSPTWPWPTSWWPWRPRRRTRRRSPTPAASPMPRWPTGAWCTRPCSWPRSGARPCTSAASCRATSSTTPTRTGPGAGRARGSLGIDMEAAVLYTIGALRGVATLAVLTVSDTLYGESRGAHLRRRAAPGRGPHDRAGRSRGDRRFVV